MLFYHYFLNIASALAHRFPLLKQALNKLLSNSIQFNQAGWWSATSYCDVRNRNLFSIGTGHFKYPCQFPLLKQTLNKLQSNSIQISQARWWSATSYHDVRNRNLFLRGTGIFKDPCRRAMHYPDGEDNCLFYQSQNIGDQSSMKIRI